MTDPTDLDALRDAFIAEVEKHGMGSLLHRDVGDAWLAYVDAQRPTPVPTEPGAYYLESGEPAVLARVDGLRAWLREGNSLRAGPVKGFTWATDAGELVKVPTLKVWQGTVAAHLNVMEQRDEALAKLARVREVVEQGFPSIDAHHGQMRVCGFVVSEAEMAELRHASLEGGTDGE